MCVTCHPPIWVETLCVDVEFSCIRLVLTLDIPSPPMVISFWKKREDSDTAVVLGRRCI